MLLPEADGSVPMTTRRLVLSRGAASVGAGSTGLLAANPPLAIREQLYAALTDWVEKEFSPTTSAVTPNNPVAKSRPICKLMWAGTSMSPQATRVREVSKSVLDRVALWPRRPQVAPERSAE